MSKILINEKEYETDLLSDKAKTLLGSLKVLDDYILKINNEMKIYGAAKRSYVTSLQSELEEYNKLNSAKPEKKVTTKKPKSSVKSKK